MRVFVTGGTGLIGTRIVRALEATDDETVVLTRRPAAARERLGAACTIVEGDPTESGRWMDAVETCDAVVNLAGESLTERRWSPRVEARIRDSRVRSTQHVVRALARSPRTTAGLPKALVNASAVGYYGPRGDEEITEEARAGDDFLARVCVDWEKAASAGEEAGLRVVMIRTGPVLDARGGMLAELLPAFRWFVGGPLGSGDQWLSWIHHHDLIGIYRLALTNGQARGPINGTAPRPVTNRLFARALGRVMHRPSLVRVPRLALRVLLGGAADTVTTGQRVRPERAQALGYAFHFPSVEHALRDVLSEHDLGPRA